jgi:uncharacterized protein
MNLFEKCQDRQLGSGLRWLNEPPTWTFDADHRLHMEPTACTDFFRPPDQDANDGACLLYTAVRGDFTLSARVAVHLKGFGDAGGLVLRAQPDCWAKLCVERSPAGEVGVVSVVTAPFSDDANSELLDRPEAHLRITRKGRLFGMHYSVDGDRWRFVRAFAMDVPEELMVGAHAQAPFTGGCRADIDFLQLQHTAVQDFRSGE